MIDSNYTLVWAFAAFVIAHILFGLSGEVRKTMTWKQVMVALIAPAMILLSPFYYQLPNEKQGTVPITFDDGRVIENVWGLLAPPWSDREWVLHTRCRPVGFSKGQSKGVQERAVLLVGDGEVRVEEFSPMLCMDYPALFYSDSRHRRNNSEEARTTWERADAIALKAFFSPEMVAVRNGVGTERSIRWREFLLTQLIDLGFAVRVQ